MSDYSSLGPEYWMYFDAFTREEQRWNDLRLAMERLENVEQRFYRPQEPLKN